MTILKTYKKDDKMFDVICDKYHMLNMMSRFGIPVGVGDKTIEDICNEHHVDIDTFLALANYIKTGKEVAYFYINKIDVETLLDYLCRSHNYYLNFVLPHLRRRLIDAIDVSTNNEIALLILKFYDEFIHDVRHHMKMENEKVFANVRKLLEHQRKNDFHIANYFRSHLGMDIKLQELKKVIIKYYNNDRTTEKLNSVLFGIFSFEEDLRTHCNIEDDLFVPAVKLLEESASTIPSSTPLNTPTEELSARERDVIIEIVKGKTNKEVAADLFISINTVITHRKNIANKLGIHSIAGLTIYAIVNKLIDIEEIKEETNT